MDSSGTTILQLFTLHLLPLLFQEKNKHEMRYQGKELEKRIVNGFELLIFIFQGECWISGNRKQLN